MVDSHKFTKLMRKGDFMRRKNILLTLSVLFLLVLGFASYTVFAGNEIKVTVDGVEVQFEDQLPVLVDGYVLVPVRHVFDHLGFDVSWDRSTRVATVTSEDINVVIPATGSHFYVNGEEVVPAVLQMLQNGRLLLPVDAIADIIDATVIWDVDARLVEIITVAYESEPEPEPEPTNEVTEDMLRFKYEYESFNDQPNPAGTAYFQNIYIPEFNLIRYVTPEEILAIAESGTGLIYFGFPNCPWCRQMTPLLIDIALEMGVDTIYYINMLPIRTIWDLDEDGEPIMVYSGHPYYQDLLIAFESVIEPMSLNPFYFRGVNTEELRIFVPTVVAIRDGEIVASHVYTVPASYPPLNNGNQWLPLSEDETAYLRAIYEELIRAMLD